MFDLVLGELQLRLRAVRDRSEMVPNSHQDDQQQHGNPKPHRQLQAMRVKTKDDDLERDKAKHTSKIGAEASGGDRIDQQAGAATVEGNGDCRHQDHRGDCKKLAGLWSRERIQVQPNEKEAAKSVPNPQQRPCMLPYRIHEEPDHEGEPYERHPPMAVLVGINLPPECAKGSHRFLDPYCCLEWVLGTTVYQITATAVIATPSQFQWPPRVSAVKITMATAQRTHCAFLLFITTLLIRSKPSPVSLLAPVKDARTIAGFIR